MNKNYLLLLVPAVLFSIMLSCKSTPEKTEEPLPQKEEAPALDLSALNDAAGQAEAARTFAVDFNTPSYFPSDWETVETQYTDAKAMPLDTAEDIQKATDAYTAVTADYKGLSDKAIPLYAQAREDEIMASRGTLIGTDFINSFPEYLDGADALALQAQDQYDSSDYYAAKDTAAAALAKYQALNSGAGAFQTRQEIVTRGFDAYDPDDFSKADDSGDAAIAAYKAGDIKGAKDSADEAQLRYNLVLNTGWASFAAEKGTAAGTMRQQTIDAKGNVASRNEFNAADDVYNQAETAMKGEKYSDASDLYQKAEAQFADVMKLTEDKRARAEAAIQEAADRAAASDEAARQAEEIIGGVSE